MTFPFSSTTTSTSTTPATCILRAASGYNGVGRLSALPLSTPPDTGFSRGRGAGGGSLSVIITFLRASDGVVRKSAANGAAVNLSLSKEVGGGKAAEILFSDRFVLRFNEDPDVTSFPIDADGIDCWTDSSVLATLGVAG